ncbi:MAG: prephenate dehydratase [Anaerotignaceae bacterium]
MKIGYLGPEGTFTHQAALKYTNSCKNFELIGFPVITDVLQAVENGEVDEGVVPFENSIEGTVTFTIDSLIFDVDVVIEAEIIIPIRHNLVAKKSCVAEDLVKILSHPQALAQCRKYLERKFRSVEKIQFGSTAGAAKLISETSESWGAICTAEAAQAFGLEILDEDIQDENQNKTRFLVVSKKHNAKPVYEGKTSIVFSTEDKPGELYKILDIISIWDLNMTKIESRPMKNELGKYVFYVDMESGNAADIRDAIKMIERKTAFFKHLGTYHTLM